LPRIGGISSNDSRHASDARLALGEHNEYVYKEVLGLSDDEIADLLIDGVITTEADLPTIY